MTIAHLRTFNTEELLDLLRDCANNLAIAYQETSEPVLFNTSEAAWQACDYLMYEIERNRPNHLIH